MITGWRKLEGKKFSNWQLLPRAEGGSWGLEAEAALTQISDKTQVFLKQLIEQLELWILYHFYILEQGCFPKSYNYVLRYKPQI